MITALLVGAAAWLLVVPPARSRLRAVFGPLRPVRRLDPAVAAAASVPVAGLLLIGWPWGVIVGLAAAPVAHRLVGRLETTTARRTAAAMSAQLPFALDLMVAMLDAGRPPVTAFAVAAEAAPAPLRGALSTVADRLAVSPDATAVWTSLSTDPALSGVGRAFRLAEESGMPVARVVAGLGEELRRARRSTIRQRAGRVGVRTAAPLGVCFLPAFFLVGIVPVLVGSFRSLAF